MSETLSQDPDGLGVAYTTLAPSYPSTPATPSSTVQDAPPGANLPPFSTFSSDMDSNGTFSSVSDRLFSDTRLLDISNWDYYTETRLIDRGENGLSIISSQPQYRPWESKPLDSTSAFAATTQVNTFTDSFSPPNGAPKLPSFQSQFQAFSDPATTSEPTLTTLTNLTPVSPNSSSSPQSQTLTPLSSSFHTLSAVNPRGYPLVPAPIQAREVPSIQQQFLDERHIQLYSHPTANLALNNTIHSASIFPAQNGAIIQNSQIISSPTVVTLLKSEPDMKLTTLHQASPGLKLQNVSLHPTQFQNPMTALNSDAGLYNGIDKKINGNTGIMTSPTRNDFRKKERRKMRANSLESSAESDGNSNMDLANENSGQVAAVSSTDGFKTHHGMPVNMEHDISAGSIDKQVKKKRKRCGECVGCQKKDNCGDCAPCRNDKSHQICKLRRCEKLTEKKSLYGEPYMRGESRRGRGKGRGGSSYRGRKPNGPITTLGASGIPPPSENSGGPVIPQQSSRPSPQPPAGVAQPMPVQQQPMTPMPFYADPNRFSTPVWQTDPSQVSGWQGQFIQQIPAGQPIETYQQYPNGIYQTTYQQPAFESNTFYTGAVQVLTPTNARPPSAPSQQAQMIPQRPNSNYAHTPSPGPTSQQGQSQAQQQQQTQQAQAQQQTTNRSYQDYNQFGNNASNDGSQSRPSSVNSVVNQNPPTPNQNYTQSNQQQNQQQQQQQSQQQQTQTVYTTVSAANFSPSSNQQQTQFVNANSGNGQPGYPQVNASSPQVVSHNSSGYSGNDQFGGHDSHQQWQSQDHQQLLWEQQQHQQQQQQQQQHQQQQHQQHQQQMQESKMEQHNYQQQAEQQQQQQQHVQYMTQQQKDHSDLNSPNKMQSDNMQRTFSQADKVNLNTRIKTMILNKQQNDAKMEQDVKNVDQNNTTGHFLWYSHHQHLKPFSADGGPLHVNLPCNDGKLLLSKNTHNFAQNNVNNPRYNALPLRMQRPFHHNHNKKQVSLTAPHDGNYLSERKFDTFKTELSEDEQTYTLSPKKNRVSRIEEDDMTRPNQHLQIPIKEINRAEDVSVPADNNFDRGNQILKKHSTASTSFTYGPRETRNIVAEDVSVPADNNFDRGNQILKKHSTASTSFTYGPRETRNIVAEDVSVPANNNFDRGNQILKKHSTASTSFTYGPRETRNIVAEDVSVPADNNFDRGNQILKKHSTASTSFTYGPRETRNIVAEDVSVPANNNFDRGNQILKKHSTASTCFTYGPRETRNIVGTPDSFAYGSPDSRSSTPIQSMNNSVQSPSVSSVTSPRHPTTEQFFMNSSKSFQSSSRLHRENHFFAPPLPHMPVDKRVPRLQGGNAANNHHEVVPPKRNSSNESSERTIYESPVTSNTKDRRAIKTDDKYSKSTNHASRSREQIKSLIMHKSPPKIIGEEIPRCHCFTSDQSPPEPGTYYTHLGCANNLKTLRHNLECQTGVNGTAIRIERVRYTGKEGKTAQGCPIVKWVHRRVSLEEKYLVVVKHRTGHFCHSAFIVICLVVWDGVSQSDSDDLYSLLTSKITKFGLPTKRRCATNDPRTCACQGVNEDTCGASFTFGCSWSMYYNGCKFTRSKDVRKFRLSVKEEERLLEEKLQNLADHLSPIYKTLAPQSFCNQTSFEHVASECRLGNQPGRPFSGVTACLDFCAHAHKDIHNMNNGCTVVVTLTKHRDRSKPDDEQFHVLPLYVPEDTDEFGSKERQDMKVRIGEIEVLDKFESEVRTFSEPAEKCKNRKGKKEESQRKRKSATPQPSSPSVSSTTLLQSPKDPSSAYNNSEIQSGQVSSTVLDSPNRTPSWRYDNFISNNESSFGVHSTGNNFSNHLPQFSFFKMPNSPDSGSFSNHYSQDGYLNSYAKPRSGNIAQHPTPYLYSNFTQSYASPYRVSNPFDDLYSNNAPPMPLGPKPSESTSKKVLIEYTDNRECFADPEVGGVAIALTHGSVLFECAKHELHATTALKKPDRSNPTRISLVFYQHRSLNKSQHGLDEYTMKQKNKADTSNSDSVEFDSSFESVSLNSSLERVSGGEVAKRTPTMPTYSLTTMFPMYPCMVTGPYQEHYGGTLSIPHK